MSPVKISVVGSKTERRRVIVEAGAGEDIVADHFFNGLPKVEVVNWELRRWVPGLLPGNIVDAVMRSRFRSVIFEPVVSSYVPKVETESRGGNVSVGWIGGGGCGRVYYDASEGRGRALFQPITDQKRGEVKEYDLRGGFNEVVDLAPGSPRGRVRIKIW